MTKIFSIPAELAAFAHSLADETGALLRGYFRQNGPVEHKSDASPVTKADREVEALLRARIAERYPEHGITGEELGSTGKDSPYQWIIDPIDGTRSFIAGYPLFTTLIALAYKNVPLLGVIDQPVLGERWLGLQGSVTLYSYRHRREDKDATPIALKIHKENEISLQNASIATTSIDYFTPDQAALFQTLRHRCANTVLGGDAYAYAMLAQGQIDAVIDAGLKQYDFCALKPVIEGAGGIISDWQGNPITTQSDGRILASSNLKLHDEILTRLVSQSNFASSISSS